MSGRRNKTQGDVNKSRNEYMETLNLQAKINDENLQANKTYLLTGQLPPQSQMQDTRTNAEKLKDIDLLKQNIAKGLAPIAEPQFATQIVETVMNSPLNVDNTLLRFLAQRTPTIAEQLKKIYSYGIKGDANDLQRIVEYIRNMYSETQGRFMTTKSYMNSVSSSSQSSRVISANDLDPVISGIDDIIKNIYMMKHRGNVAGMAGINTVLNRVKRRLDELKLYLPKTEEIDRLVKDNNMMNTYKGDISTLYKHLENLPKYTEVMALINKIKEYISSDSLTTARSGINNLERLFSGILNPTVLTELQNFRNHVKIPIQQEIKFQNEMESIQTMENLEDERRRLHSKSKAQKVWIINPEEDAVWVRNTRALGGIPSSVGATDGSISSNVGDSSTMSGLTSVNPSMVDISSSGGPSSSDMSSEFRGPSVRSVASRQLVNGDIIDILEDYRDKLERHDIYDDEMDYLEKIIHDLEDELDVNYTGGEYLNELTSEELLEIVNNLIDDIGGRLLGVNDVSSVSSVSSPSIGSLSNSTNSRPQPLSLSMLNLPQGNGIRKRRAGRPRGGSVKPPPPPKVPNYVGFGVNEINKKNLEKGIFTMRRNTKTNYMDMPSKHVSKNLQSIIKTMIGGGVPKYEELGKLDDEEKEYLYKIVSRSNMEDKLSVPAPSKDQQEKDIHNFEVMKGQLMSGNDSQELVKSFKLLTRKLARQGLLPKADVEDIMDTLLSLGY